MYHNWHIDEATLQGCGVTPSQEIAGGPVAAIDVGDYLVTKVRAIMSTTINPPPTRDTQSLAEWLKILADPTRLHIFNLLMQGVQCNCELGDQLHLPRNLISHHLTVLRQAGLVDMERDPLDARWIYYSVNPAALAELNRAFNAFFNPDRIQPRRAYCGPQAALSEPAEVNATNPVDIEIIVNS